MGMAVPANSTPMAGAPGQYDYITMGGMFTILKVRDELPGDGSDPGWYKSPPGTVAEAAREADLQRDGIELPKTTARWTSAPDAWCGEAPAGTSLLAKNEGNGPINVQ